MSLRENDLKDTVLSKISIDEFEPKTGDAKDVMVLGFYLNQDTAADDLYHFLSSGIQETRDIEVSPNPNEDGYYMVFIEVDRNDKAVDTLKGLVKETERVAGSLNWKAKTYLNDEYLPLSEDGIYQYIITDPSKYVTREEFEANRAAAEAARVEEEKRLEEEAVAQNNSDSILEFLKATNLLRACITDGKLHIQDRFNTVSLDVVNFGEGKAVMSELGINESAIKTDFDRTLFGKLKSMLGEMVALPIDQYIVIYDPRNQQNILVTKPL